MNGDRNVWREAADEARWNGGPPSFLRNEGDAAFMEMAAAPGREPTASPGPRDTPQPALSRSVQGLGLG